MSITWNFLSMMKQKIARLERSMQGLHEQLSFAQAECFEKDVILAKQAKVAEEAILGTTLFTSLSFCTYSWSIS
jgi:hypothetical protein